MAYAVKEKLNEHAQTAWQQRYGMNYGYFLAYATILTLCHVVPDSNGVTGGRSRTPAEPVLRDLWCSKAHAFQPANSNGLYWKKCWINTIAFNGRNRTGLTFFMPLKSIKKAARAATYFANISAYLSSPPPQTSTTEDLLRNCCCIGASFHLSQPLCFVHYWLLIQGSTVILQHIIKKLLSIEGDIISLPLVLLK